MIRAVAETAQTNPIADHQGWRAIPLILLHRHGDWLPPYRDRPNRNNAHAGECFDRRDRAGTPLVARRRGDFSRFPGPFASVKGLTFRGLMS